MGDFQFRSTSRYGGFISRRSPAMGAFIFRRSPAMGAFIFRRSPAMGAYIFQSTPAMGAYNTRAELLRIVRRCTVPKPVLFRETTALIQVAAEPVLDPGYATRIRTGLWRADTGARTGEWLRLIPFRQNNTQSENSTTQSTTARSPYLELAGLISSKTRDHFWNALGIIDKKMPDRGYKQSHTDNHDENGKKTNTHKRNNHTRMHNHT